MWPCAWGRWRRGAAVPLTIWNNLSTAFRPDRGLPTPPQQRQAVALAAESQVMLLTGGPGTGKTTCLRGVLALFDQLGLETALAAPTGRAAKRLGELCGTEAYTIHRLLETQYDPRSGQLIFAHDESDPLKADAVIVDETSMVDITLMQALLAALRSDCRLILVGDPDQLPSVGPATCSLICCAAGRSPGVRLCEIFRQSARSAIVQSAHQVNRGELPPLRGAGDDFFFLRRTDPAWAAQTIVELVADRLPRNMGIPPDQIQVLSPHPPAAGGHRGSQPGPPGGGQPAGGGQRGAALWGVGLPGGGPGDAGAKQLRRDVEAAGRPECRHGDLQRGYRPGDPGG